METNGDAAGMAGLSVGYLLVYSLLAQISIEGNKVERKTRSTASNAVMEYPWTILQDAINRQVSTRYVRHSATQLILHHAGRDQTRSTRQNREAPTKRESYSLSW